MIRVAVGIIFNHQGQVLLALRPKHKPYPDLWEFPGGKVEDNESVLDALKRELLEEIGIDVLSAEPLMQKHYQYPDREVLLDVWRVTEFANQPRGLEGQELKWYKPEDVAQLKLPAANYDIVEIILQRN